MCTKEEVRQVLHETVTPAWARRLLGAIVTLGVLFMGWLAYETHMQDEARLKQAAMVTSQLNSAAMEHAKANAELSAKIDNIRFIFAASAAETVSRVDRIALEIEHVKELALSRSKDRWTGKDAKARNELVDERERVKDLLSQERNKVVDRRLEEIEDVIAKHHDKK